MRAWIEELSQLGLAPSITALEAVSGPSSKFGLCSELGAKALKLEQKWMAQLQAEGEVLLNSFLHDWSDNAIEKAKISERHFS
jgi:hypothetical protein